MKLYHSPLTRSVRVIWLLEELGLAYELETVTFTPPTDGPFQQATPSGKIPTLDDDGIVLFESGAIVEWIVERHGGGRLTPAIGTPGRAALLQWIHFAESTGFIGMGCIAWHTRFRNDADKLPEAMADYASWVKGAMDVVEKTLDDGRPFLLGDMFSAADCMMGYTVSVAGWMGLLGQEHARVAAYAARLAERPAFQKALSI